MTISKAAVAANCRINAPVLPVTRLACARRTPARPARYAWR